MVLAPVQYQSTEEYSWMKSFYDNITISEMANKENIKMIKKLDPPKKEEEIKYDG